MWVTQINNTMGFGHESALHKGGSYVMDTGVVCNGRQLYFGDVVRNVTQMTSFKFCLTTSIK